jgi:hypothetical protein
VIRTARDNIKVGAERKERVEKKWGNIKRRLKYTCQK